MTDFDEEDEEQAGPPVPPFVPVGERGHFRRNAVQYEMDDAAIGFGFVAAGDALVTYWQEHGPDDGLFVPMVWNYRHGLELLFKAAIRDAAKCLRRNDASNPGVAPTAVDAWLRRKAGHSLGELVDRLDDYLTRLRLEPLHAEARDVVMALHALDPGGDAFRYAMTWDKKAKAVVKAKRPPSTHVDVVAMGEYFRGAAMIVGGGVLSVLEVYADNQRDMDF